MDARKPCRYCNHELRDQRMLMGGWDGTMYIDGQRIVYQSPGRPGSRCGDTVRSDPIRFCPMCGRRL